MKQKNTILWIHGWGSNANVWSKLVSQFPDCHHIFPSFGSAGTPDEFLKCVTAQLPTSGCTVIGWSMGAMLAIEAAAEYPTRINRLICFNTSFRFADRDRNLGWSPSVISKMKQSLMQDPSRTLSAFIDSLVFETETSGAPFEALLPGKDSIRRDSAECDFSVDGLAAGLDYLKNVDLNGEIESLRQPVLWIHGERDTICPIDRFDELKERYAGHSNHQFKALPNTGHVSFFEKADETLEIIKDFLNETND